MAIQPGAKVWIPCRVRRGEFPDERVVHVDGGGANWDGFVRVEQLREPIAEGETAIEATVVEATERTVFARLPGQVKRRHFFSAPACVFEGLAPL